MGVEGEDEKFEEDEQFEEEEKAKEEKEEGRGRGKAKERSKRAFKTDFARRRRRNFRGLGSQSGGRSVKRGIKTNSDFVRRRRRNFRGLGPSLRLDETEDGSAGSQRR